MNISSETGADEPLRENVFESRWLCINDPWMQLLLACGAVVFALGLSTGSSRNSGIVQPVSIPTSTAGESMTLELVQHP